MRIERSALDPETERWRLFGGEGALSLRDVFSGWADDAAFRAGWIAGLREVPFKGFCWECPPATAATSARPFECVFVSSPELADFPADHEPFADQFHTGVSVTTFGNLGGDAILVAPCPGPDGSNYSHLASFTATASPVQQDALWQAVGATMQRRIGTSPIWLSTAGHGVAWVHVRLDSRPKYYRHMPYTRG
jgi:hypothetical protein